MKKLSNRKVVMLYSGLALLFAFAFLSFYSIIRAFEDPRMNSAAMFNIGVDVLGSFVCAVLYFGIMGERENQADVGIRWFIVLIIQNSIAFFINEWEYLLVGVTEYNSICRFLYVAENLYDLFMVFTFFRFVYITLGFEGKVANIMNRIFAILLVFFSLATAVNLFTPLFFSVDELGYFHELPLNWISDLYLIIVAPITAFYVLRSKVSLQQKLASLSFILIPTIHFYATGSSRGYATQYGSVLISIIVIYCLLFYSRSRQLALTQKELDMASQIQESMMPSVFPPFPERKEFDIYATVEPAKGVGGDFYDFFFIDDDHLCLVMADVSGKGIPAALFMMISKIILQNCVKMGFSVSDALTKTNDTLCINNSEGMFVTVWLGILEISSGKLYAGNAGHEYPALKKKDGSFKLLKDRHDLVIGAMEGLKYNEYMLELEPGDKLFLYTDGVPEAVNKLNKAYGTDRMIDALNSDRDADAAALVKNVRSSIASFVKSAEQFDDITMMAVEYKGKEK
ncbi:MAG: serine/threonine-protein phosphatase [Erysipelotrichaceae bacterium]|nr:serine/threonine-protein phosphatase [Erysipelotrichaceae bacterium]